MSSNEARQHVRAPIYLGTRRRAELDVGLDRVADERRRRSSLCEAPPSVCTDLAHPEPMEEKPSPSLAYVPAGANDLDDLATAARRCQACDLYKRATQTVFGEGPAPAPMMLVGEQPGDREDVVGRPFVGPAGRLLDECLEAAEIPRDQVYVTNAVKHFKWEPRGKRRLHSKPNAVEIHACRG